MPLRMQYINLTLLDERKKSNNKDYLFWINSHAIISEFHAVNLIQNLLTVADNIKFALLSDNPWIFVIYVTVNIL